MGNSHLSTDLPSGLSESQPAPGLAERALRVEAEQVKLLYAQAFTGFVVGTLTVAVVVFILWNAVDLRWLLAWVAFMGVVTLPVFVVVCRFILGAFCLSSAMVLPASVGERLEYYCSPLTLWLIKFFWCSLWEAKPRAV
jgi:hypothetical protein